MQNVLEGLANDVGKLIRVDKDSLHDFNKMVAKVMVEFDIAEGLQ